MPLPHTCLRFSLSDGGAVLCAACVELDQSVTSLSGAVEAGVEAGTPQLCAAGLRPEEPRELLVLQPRSEAVCDKTPSASKNLSLFL